MVGLYCMFKHKINQYCSETMDLAYFIIQSNAYVNTCVIWQLPLSKLTCICLIYTTKQWQHGNAGI